MARKNRSSSPLRITVAYALLAIAWILLTSLAVHVWLPRADRETVEIAKGIAFILASAIALYVLLRHLQNAAVKVAAQEYLATRDPLTHLLNQAAWKEQVVRKLTTQNPTLERAAVVLVDIDHLRYINSGLGNQVGDYVLRRVASMLLRSAQGGDLLARSGHGEFALFLTEGHDRGNLIALAEKILAEFRHALHVGHDPFRVSLSIGICRFPEDAGSVDGLLGAAGMALQEAKKRGGRQYELYKGELSTDQITAYRLESHLHEAIRENQFVVHYQPIFRLPESRITAVEALVRWQHPQYGLMAPGQFIGIAERAGLIDAIGEIVLRTACRDAVRFAESTGEPVSFAVNLSAIQLDGKGLFKKVNDILNATGCPPTALTIEITESTAMREPDQIIRTLAAFREMGIRIAIDDFGTGYSSLAYLQRLPISELKVDRTFVERIHTREESLEIIRAIIALGHSLKLDIVAEGVETVAQLRILTELGCDRVQGFLLAKPMTFAELMKTWAKTDARARTGEAPLATGE